MVAKCALSGSICRKEVPACSIVWMQSAPEAAQYMHVHCVARACQPAEQGCAGTVAAIAPVVLVLQDVYLSARENNWGVHYRRGSWFLTYDL